MMKKTITAVVLCGTLLCSSIPVMAASAPSTTPVAKESNTQTTAPEEMPDSVLYYGTVQEIIKDENGAVTAIWMESEQFGSYVMKISSKTVWIDSEKQTTSDSATLEKGESLYVYHSPMATRSLPPQSEAFAIVRNNPQDITCAKYHKVEEVSEENGIIRVTTDNGGLFLLADKETKVVSQRDGSAADLTQLKEGNHIVAWYGAVALSYPGQAHSSCIMVLTQEEEKALTRIGTGK